jgi:hypothetical protein
MDDYILRSQLEQLIQEGYNLTNIASGYLKTFKKKLINFYDGKLKAKLEILFPAIQFQGIHIILLGSKSHPLSTDQQRFLLQHQLQSLAQQQHLS